MEGLAADLMIDPQQHAKRRADDDQLREDYDVLKQQLNWLQRQLFGRKSEKPLIESPDQMDLGALLGDAVPPSAPSPTEKISYTRRKGKQRRDEDVTASGLRFDERVPIETIELSAPQLQGAEAEQFEIIDYKVTGRLAQRPGNYVVLEYRRPVIRDKRGAALLEVPAPSAVFDNSLADAGITVNRPTLTHYAAQWQHILQSKVLAMDGTPIKGKRLSFSLSRAY